jgi:hypothetical protein
MLMCVVPTALIVTFNLPDTLNFDLSEEDVAKLALSDWTDR